jgi:hypothetical protein
VRPFAWSLLASLLSFGCATRVDPTFSPKLDEPIGGAPPTIDESHCEDLLLPDRIFLVCSTPDVPFADAAADCQQRGGELVRIRSAEENAVLVAQAREQATHSNIWLGGTRDDDHVWRWSDGSVFWNGLADGTAESDVFTNWQNGEPNNMSTVTDEPERCVALALFDGGWRDRSCSLALSYFCELTGSMP